MVGASAFLGTGERTTDGANGLTKRAAADDAGCWPMPPIKMTSVEL
jgi:hypothetical protein